MSFRPPTSRRRYEQYRRDLKAHETVGSENSAAAHHKRKGGAHRSFFTLFRTFWTFVPGKGAVAVSLGTVTIATALKLIPPAATGLVLDSVLGEKALPAWFVTATGGRLGVDDPVTLLRAVALGLVAISIVSIAIGITGRYLNTVNAKRTESGVRRRVFSHAVRLPLHRIHQLKSGGVASILREDAGGVGELLFSMVYNPWRAIIQLGGTLTILAIIDWRLLVGSLAIIPIVYFTHRAWISSIRPLWRDIRESRRIVDGHATEAFGGMRVVRSFGRQRTETGRFIRNNHLMIRQEIMAWVASRSVEISWAILIPAASALLLWYGGERILEHRGLVAAGVMASQDALTTGDLVMFLFYLAMLLEPLATLAGSATAFQNSLAGLDRVLDMMEEPTELDGATGTELVNPATVAGRIELENVAFTYPGAARPVLRNIGFVAEPGQTVAIVGASGAGKTTLCNLVARFHDPTTGVIRLDGHDLRDLDVESFRRLLGVVEQDIFLFDGTIAENIAYGRRHATEDDVRRAAVRAHADDFIRGLDDGYDTIIGERGVRLSGGQRQRLAIARALLANPRILILDEATSSLDTESERLIQDSLEELMEGRTSFVIAHRLSTIVNATLILVLDDGEIVERGTHAELMAGETRYRRMVEIQSVGGVEQVVT